MGLLRKKNTKPAGGDDRPRKPATEVDKQAVDRKEQERQRRSRAIAVMLSLPRR